MSLFFGPPSGLPASAARGSKADSKAPCDRVATDAALRPAKSSCLSQPVVQKLWTKMTGKLKTVRGLTLVLQLKYGHQYTISMRQPSGQPAWSAAQGHPIIVAVPPDQSHDLYAPGLPVTSIVIDPFFRELFAIGRSDLEFDSFVRNELPEVFVGPVPMLHAMLEVANSMLHAALGRLRLRMPPGVQLQLAKMLAATAAACQGEGSPQQAPEVCYTGSGKCTATAGNAGCPRVMWYRPEPKVVVVGFNVAADAHTR